MNLIEAEELVHTSIKRYIEEDFEIYDFDYKLLKCFSDVYDSTLNIVFIALLPYEAEQIVLLDVITLASPYLYPPISHRITSFIDKDIILEILNNNLKDYALEVLIDYIDASYNLIHESRHSKGLTLLSHTCLYILVEYLLDTISLRRSNRPIPPQYLSTYPFCNFFVIHLEEIESITHLYEPNHD